MIEKRFEINIGEKVQLVEQVKKELVSHYESSKGMSGINPIHVDNEFTVKYFDGSNIGVENPEGISYSFNYGRFMPVKNGVELK
ncbi:hypothetical protein HOD29_06800 [archaeon]|jgi:hypothetical protein|nr:hypothetical protein [archaeon]